MTYVRRIPSTDPRLGRHVAHDPMSRGFALSAAIDTSTWHTKAIRIYDPLPNPNQTIGNCTGCAKAMMFNAVGNRKIGVVLGMKTADKIYSKATTLDSFDGQYLPDDTGSSGLGAAKAAQALGYGGLYRWLFGGADEVVQAVMDGHVVNVGTRWDNRMFDLPTSKILSLGGGVAGGHEWTVHRYDADRDLVGGRCWWGDFRNFWIKRSDFAELMADDGDAHVQVRV